MRPNGIGLKHHAELALLRRDPTWWIVRRKDSTCNANIATIRCFEPRDATKQGGFPGAAGTDDNEQLAFGDIQVERLDRGNDAVAHVKTFMQAANGDHAPLSFWFSVSSF